MNGKEVYSLGLLVIDNLPIVNCWDGTNISGKNIKSIVTKEQFESISYKVKE